MPTPGENKTVQSRILAYAEAIGWTFVPREIAEQRLGFDPQITQISTDSKPAEYNLRKSAKFAVTSQDRARNRSLFFDDLLDARVREFNLRYAEANSDIFTPASMATGIALCTVRRAYLIPRKLGFATIHTIFTT